MRTINVPASLPEEYVALIEKAARQIAEDLGEGLDTLALAALLISAALAALARLPGNSARAWLIAYYVLQVASIEAIAIMGPVYIRPVNTAHALVVAVLFVAWATLGIRGQHQHPRRGHHQQFGRTTKDSIRSKIDLLINTWRGSYSTSSYWRC